MTISLYPSEQKILEEASLLYTRGNNSEFIAKLLFFYMTNQKLFNKTFKLYKRSKNEKKQK